jgi:pyruvate dehydrogenase E1 component alpha subunit
MAKDGKAQKYSKEQYLKWYEEMLLYRKFEDKASACYIQQKIRGFCHLYIGQEAIIAGYETYLGKEDSVITTYRDHCHPIGRGTDPNIIMAELFGKTTGISRGRGGSMHMFDKEKGFYGGHGIVGAHIPLGAGVAFAEKYRGTKNVNICLMGDGAVRQGAFHEALNMAMTWKLPVVFVIENNMYAMGTSIERTSNVTELYKLGHAYEMPSFAVNGMKVEDCANAFEEAIDRARKGEGPTLLEIRTYRYKGHSMSDPAKYRSKDELNSFKDRDPIADVLSTIKEHDYASDDELKVIEDRVKKIVSEAEKFAEEGVSPADEDIYDGVYSQEDYPFIKEF